RKEALFFFSIRRRHTRFDCDWSSDVCSSDLFSANVANSNNSQWLESTYNAPVSTPHGPYEGELILHSCADGKIRRFAHNFSDGSPASNSIFASSVAQISSDGNYAVVATKFQAFQAFWDQFAEATLNGLTLTVDGTAKT